MCYNTGKYNDGGHNDDSFFPNFCGGLCAPLGASHAEYSLCGPSAVGRDY